MFLQVLEKEQALYQVFISKMTAGHSPPPKKEKYQDLSKRIAMIVEDYENKELEEYLKEIAYNFQF